MSNNKNICDCYYCEGKFCYRIDARDCEGHIDILITECEEHPDCEHKQLNQLKTENEALKNNDVFSIRLFKDKADKYKQTLTEIKEIATKIIEDYDGNQADKMQEEAGLIIKTINEVQYV